MPPEHAWSNRFVRLNDALVQRGAQALGVPWEGQGLPDATWGAVSDAATELLGWPADWWQRSQSALTVFSGQGCWAGMQPMATVYSGHQFGQWAGQLGDGRALLLGEWAGPHGGVEVQLKGAGPTPYSRRGDGRAVLRSSIREYLCSEAMHALGIPTTRALCLVASPLPVRREVAETAAVVTRLSPSFIRFGHFEHFAYRPGEPARRSLEALVQFTLAEHMPQHAHLKDPVEQVHALLGEACQRTADLMAQWQTVGFCHGVMNTDNMSILGLTLDYGPFGFMDAFDPDHVCNHSDTSGRYRWRLQPDMAGWNLAALAQALSALVPGADQEHNPDRQALLDALRAYDARFSQQMLMRWCDKLGLQSAEEADETLINDWLALLARGHVDFTIAFRRLGQWRADLAPEHQANATVRDLFLDRQAFDAWAVRYGQRLAREGSIDAERQPRMDRVNPWVVLRNHLAQQAIDRAERGDFSEVQRLEQVLSNPFEVQPEHADCADFPPDWAASLEVSCSS